MAERVHQQTPSSTNYQQRRYFSYVLSISKIPRPKKHVVLFYMVKKPVTNASNANKPSKRHMLPFGSFKISKRLFANANQN